MADMKNRRIASCAHLVLALGCLVNAARSFAQQPKAGQISGHVVDVVGATVKGASVFVRRNIPAEEKIALLAHTDINGDFKLALPEGGYDVLVTSPGFAARVETVAVPAGKPMRIELKLKALDCSFPRMNCDTLQ
ncbi:carboxypeptidase-like regulatory domain-containing protein [Occallatibacter savannae]|uniref:carboxypeptidase-like regulatory domain-containing protein n=1 Tax=Occallatibacter savannae TaxID=1002691 RepID=UPI0013A55B94|nr:carboxypeptidase-like regulatory domain-containing protein [Occallatibacter savannae]